MKFHFITLFWLLKFEIALPYYPFVFSANADIHFMTINTKCTKK